jgi:hypothetical protein
LQAIVGDDALDAALADPELGLLELLSDDLGRSFGVQETVAQDLALDLVGAAVIGLRTGFLGLQGRQATGLVSGQELVIALAAVAVFLGNRGDLVFQTLAFHEHEETVGQLVGGSHGQGADRTGELVGLGLEFERGIHGGKCKEGGRKCLIIYGIESA